MHLQGEIWRTVERDGNWALQGKVPGDIDDIGLLEEFVEETKANRSVVAAAQRSGYHFLIYTPFRYDPPVPPEYAARFRPPYYTKNVFYGARSLDVSIHEASFYFMRERRHLPTPSGSGEPRTTFTVGVDDAQAVDITKHPDIEKIMDRTDHAASHAYILQNPCDTLVYPSARFVGGECVAVFEIKCLEKAPRSAWQYRFQYLKGSDLCVIFNDRDEQSYAIGWGEVS
ncbi:RES family NAD+ phosphorylase [Oligoflexus tunisiensis]|uniref:RES family NAD+ phosphorylase n=1 Tax=Oligoflexus tunisiensis TaxID=708132 RepID=UPI00114D3735|nr:RES family NAD+ phosphorylase [Oligoflexus tunisiensis]